MGTKSRKTTPAFGSESPAAEAVELPERWSAQRKGELVLRLLRGEGSTPCPARARCRPTSWRPGSASFLEQGARGLRIRGEPEERELTLARAEIGELMIKLELAEHLIEKRGLTDEWKRHKR